MSYFFSFIIFTEAKEQVTESHFHCIICILMADLPPWSNMGD